MISIRTSLTLLLLSTVMTVFGVIGIAILTIRLPQIESLARAAEVERASAVSNLLDHLTKSIEERMALLGRMSFAAEDNQQAYLDAMVGDGQTFEAVFVVDKDGRIDAIGLPDRNRQLARRLRGSDFAGNTLFRTARASAGPSAGKTIWSDKYLSVMSGKYTVAVARTEADQVLIGEVSLDRVLGVLADVEPAPPAIVAIIDGQGQWLAASDRNARGRHTNYGNLPSFKAALAGQPLPAFEVVNDERMTIGGVLSKKLGWVIVSMSPAGMGNDNYRMTVLIIVGAFFGTLLLSLVIAPWWASRLSRPLNAMIERAHEVASGGRNSPWPKTEKIAELNQLAHDLETMVAVVEAREADLRIAAKTFESPQAMLVTDANNVILRVNPAFERLTGYAQAEVVGQTPRLLTSGRHGAGFYRRLWGELRRAGSWQGEVWNRKKSGEIVPMWVTIAEVKDADGQLTHFVSTQEDLSERKRADSRIEELAFFDQVSGLPNRTLLLDRLRQTQAASSRSGAWGALLMVDLDKFKTFNDIHGHELGDHLLRQAGQRLLACVRDGDTVSRVGGDEFVVVLAGLSKVDTEAASGTETVAKKVQATLAQAFALGTATHQGSASIGLTLFRGDQPGADELMKQADMALARAKESGRNTWCFFDPTMESVMKERATLEQDLRTAIEERQLVLHYQAQVGKDDAVSGAEALVRWQHPARGLVSPAEFIGLAEESGLILPLGHWVLESACARLCAWENRTLLRSLTIAVNVSAQQFRHARFIDDVRSIVRGSGADPRHLKLELTESMLVMNVEDVISKMTQLRDEGIAFSLDDFGTGYSSLSYLKRLPIDQLKIDRSFVRDILVDSNDAAIARTIVTLANSLGLGVIAEGVETIEQREFLGSIGCHAYQGYLHSRPMAAADFEAAIEAVSA